jgi:hypothetical protein
LRLAVVCAAVLQLLRAFDSMVSLSLAPPCWFLAADAKGNITDLWPGSDDQRTLRLFVVSAAGAFSFVFVPSLHAGFCYIAMPPQLSRGALTASCTATSNIPDGGCPTCNPGTDKSSTGGDNGNGSEPFRRTGCPSFAIVRPLRCIVRLRPLFLRRAIRIVCVRTSPLLRWQKLTVRGRRFL